MKITYRWKEPFSCFEELGRTYHLQSKEILRQILSDLGWNGIDVNPDAPCTSLNLLIQQRKPLSHVSNISSIIKSENVTKFMKAIS